MTAPLPRVLTLTVAIAALALGGCAKKHTATTAPQPNAVIRGHVRHLDGSLYPDALIDAQTLLPVEGAYEISTVSSDADGAFTFEGLREVAYSVSVIDNDSLAVADTVTAPASGVSIQLRPGVVLRGVAIRPDTTDLSGVVLLTDLPTAIGITDSSGAYEIRGVAPGLRMVQAFDPLGTAVASTTIQATAGDTLTVPTLHLAPGPAPAAVRPRPAAVSARAVPPRR